MANPFVSNATKVNAVIRVRRGPEIDRTQTIYENGELIYSTDKKRLFVGDSNDGGATGTIGGELVGNKNWITDNFDKLYGILKYDTVYRTDTSEFYLYNGSNYLDSDDYILLNTNQTNGANYTLPNATNSILGGVIVRDGLTVTNGYLTVNVDDSTITIDPLTKKLTAVLNNNGGNTVNTASENTLGIVKVPLDSGIKISSGSISLNVDNKTIKLSSTNDGSSKLYVDGSLVNIPVATNTNLGVIRTGDGLNASLDGTLNLNIASIGQIGGVKIGSGLTIDSTDGELSVDGTLYDSVPIGSIHWFAMSAIPAGYLECDGRIFTIFDYVDLFQVIQTTYNTGLSTQYYNEDGNLINFKIPDLRGEFVRGWDNAKGVDNGRIFGSNQSEGVGPHTHSITSYSYLRNFEGGAAIGWAGTAAGATGTSSGLETRPRNVALLPCIKALKTVNNIVVPTGNYISKPSIAKHNDILVYEDEYGTGGTWINAPSSTYAGEALLSVNGYQKLPSGLIMQWGTANITGFNYVIQFPIPFPNETLNVVATPVNTTGTLDALEINTWTSSSVTIVVNTNGANQATGTVTWQAMGY